MFVGRISLLADRIEVMAFLSCAERTWLRMNAGGKHNTCRSNGEKSESERLWTEVLEHPLEGRMEGDGSHCKRDAEKPRLTVHSDDNEEYYRHEHSLKKMMKAMKMK